jgi:putative DNA primase/helicase
MPSVTSVSDNTPVSLNRPPRGFRLFANGLHSEWVTPDGEICHARLCGWIEVTGVTHDAHGQEYGRIMEFITIDGARRRRVIPVRDIIGASRRVVGDLVDAGFDVELSGQSGLIQCLYYWRPAKRFTVTRRRGWLPDHDAFVLPAGETLGAQNVIYTGPDDLRAAPVGGTLEGWRDEIAARARGNPLLMVALSTAFSGPLVELLGLENGMLHYRGGSSSGKSTLLYAAASVWCAPDGVRRCRATANGLEGIAERANGMLLALDELAEIDGRAADAAVYMLGNGEGKTRSKSNGKISQAAYWRLMMLSSGEISLRQKLREAGRTAQAGQAVRALDIAADAQTFGAFDDLLSIPRACGHRIHEHVATDSTMMWSPLEIDLRGNLTLLILRPIEEAGERDGKVANAQDQGCFTTARVGIFDA